MIKTQISLRQITSIKQLGSVELNLIQTIDDLEKVDEKLFIGNGSNVVIDSLRVYKLANKFSYINIDNAIAIIGAATPLTLLNKTFVKNGLSGIEFLAGVPANIGGCVAMNAGAFGKQLSDIFEWAVCFDKRNGIHSISKSNSKFGYRESNFKNKIILEVALRLSKKNKIEIEKLMKKNISLRLQKAPITRTFGSVFKNPEGNFAGWLIEQCGLKGFCINDACVSQKHANYIVNLNKANATDIIKLIEIIKEKVYKAFNIVLEKEVIVV